MKKLFLLLLLVPALLGAQDSFGFDGSDFGFSGSKGPSVSIGGELGAELRVFLDDFTSRDKIKKIRAGDIFSGNLGFSVSGSSAEGLVSLDIFPVFDGSSPLEIDEAYVRAFFGPVSVTGGIRKLTWGKADSFGPLDVVNPIDFSDLSYISDPLSVKISRPMIHADWAFRSFSKLEAVFVPWFRGHKFATSGRWTPSQVLQLQGLGINVDDYYPDTYTLEYFQAGARFNATLGSSDLGVQYYSGRLNRPAVIMQMIPVVAPLVNYNHYHQVGVDFARVIAGFNLRAEAGVNITGDLDGSDGAVENPAVVWSLGFDRDIFAGINLNLQGNGSVKLFHNKIGDSIFVDCESGSKQSSTRITGIISRKFLKDELELKLTGLWGIEDRDFLLMPAVGWSRNDVSVELSAGFFGGDKSGELGQYRDNGYLKMVLSYKF